MVSPPVKLAIYDILTFGVGMGLLLTQPENSLGILVGKILMIAGVLVQFRFLKMISCMGGVRT